MGLESEHGIDAKHVGERSGGREAQGGALLMFSGSIICVTTG